MESYLAKNNRQYLKDRITRYSKLDPPKKFNYRIVKKSGDVTKICFQLYNPADGFSLSTYVNVLANDGKFKITE
jgi:hypothetical protein